MHPRSTPIFDRTDIYISHSPSNGDAYSFFASRQITARALTRASNSKEGYNSLVISEIETQVAGRGGGIVKAIFLRPEFRLWKRSLSPPPPPFVEHVKNKGS